MRDSPKSFELEARYSTKKVSVAFPMDAKEGCVKNRNSDKLYD
jgi:hypothetical protein